MASSFIPAARSMKRAVRHLYIYKRDEGDLECNAGSKYQAWVLMLAHGYRVDIEDIKDMGPVDKIVTGHRPIE